MMKRIITLLLLFLSLSCEGQEPTKIVNITTDYIKTFDIRNSPRIVYSDSTSSIYPVFMIDDIICITHPRKGNRFAIDFIKSDSHENLGHCIDFESSGNDWLAPLFYICDNSIIVHDNTTRQIAIVDVAQACRDKDYTPFIHETNIVTTRIIPYQEKILFWNPYGHDPHYPRVLLSDINWQYTDTLKYNFNALNIGHGELMLDAGQSIISFVHKREPVIDLIGLDGGLLSSLHFEHPSTEIVSFKQNSTITYIYKQPHHLTIS